MLRRIPTAPASAVEKQNSDQRGTRIVRRPARDTSCRPRLSRRAAGVARILADEILPVACSRAFPPSFAPSCRETRRHRIPCEMQAPDCRQSDGEWSESLTFRRSAVRRERSEIVLPANNSLARCHLVEVDGLHHMPGASAFQWRKNGRIPNAVTICFPLRGKSRVETLETKRQRRTRICGGNNAFRSGATHRANAPDPADPTWAHCARACTPASVRPAP